MPELEMIWTEKYRPRTLKEMIGQKHVVERLEHFVSTTSLPHCLFTGPAGCGKTTAALCIANELFKDQWRNNFLELNASVTPDTPVMVKIAGTIKRTNFGELGKAYFSGSQERIFVNNLEVLSMDDKYKIRFMPVSCIFRHNKNRIAIIRFEGGTVKASLDHSIFTIGDDGSLISKKTEDMKPGDFLITFKTELDEKVASVSVEDIRPKKFISLRSGVIKNPKVKTDFSEFELNENFSWLLGLYLAEGCTSLNKRGTGGQTIFTVAYPKEIGLGNRTKELLDEMGISVSTYLGRSGFDRSRQSSLQIRAMNTQLTKFMRKHFYREERRHARTKSIPDFLYTAPLNSRIKFLNGYFEGDGSGEWGSVARISSVSQECLIDAAWLGRLSGLETSCFKGETKIIWKSPEFSYIKSELISSKPIQVLNNRLQLEKTYELRHSLYGKKSSRMSKNIALHIIEGIKSEDKLLHNVKKLIESDLSVVKIKSIDIVDYDDYVYDVSVPGSQMFWGGTIPVLLHNSDERGIDTIRLKVKDFARTLPIAGSFKIVYLDEADALTKDAQHALRRTMEVYSNICRFVLACNYSGKIIPPIQSRTAVFRFAALKPEDIEKYLKHIANSENLEVDRDVFPLLFDLSEGDMRRAINILQTVSSSKHITEDVIYSATSKMEPALVRNMLDTALSGNFREARNQLLSLLYEKGISAEDIVADMHKQIINSDIDNKRKLSLIEKVGEYEFRLTEGSNPQIQLEALLAQIALMGKN